jgi:hypothetical protein
MLKKSKKIITFSLIIFSCLILLIGLVFAQKELEVKYPEIQGFKPKTVASSLSDYVKYIFNFNIAIIGLIGLGALIVGGIRYLTSAGNLEKIKNAKKQIKSALLGILILLFSYLILTTINPQLVIFQEPTVKPTPAAPPLPEVEISPAPSADILERIKEFAEAVKQVADSIANTAQEIKTLTDNCDCDTTQPMCVCTGSSWGGLSQIMNSFVSLDEIGLQMNSAQFFTEIGSGLLKNTNTQLITGTNTYINANAFSSGQLYNFGSLANQAKGFFGGSFQNILNNVPIYIVNNQDYNNIISQVVGRYINQFVNQGFISLEEKENFLSKLYQTSILVFNKELPATIIVNGGNFLNLNSNDLYKNFLRIYAYAIDQSYHFSLSSTYLDIYNRAKNINGFVNDYARIGGSWVDFAESIVYYYTYGIPEWISNDRNVQISIKERFDYFRDEGIVEKFSLNELEQLYQLSGSDIQSFDGLLSGTLDTNLLNNSIEQQLLPDTRIYTLKGDLTEQEIKTLEEAAKSAMESFGPEYRNRIANIPTFIADREGYRNIMDVYASGLYFQGKITETQRDKIVNWYTDGTYGLADEEGNININGRAAIEGGPISAFRHEYTHIAVDDYPNCRVSCSPVWDNIYTRASYYYVESDGKINGFVTPYARTSPAEDLAETVAVYYESYGNPAFITSDPTSQSLIQERFDYLRDNKIVEPVEWPY